MRNTPQDLGGPRVTSPTAGLVGTFAVQDTTLNSRKVLPPQLVDFSSLSATLQKVHEERKAFNSAEGEALGRRVDALQREGKTEDQIVAEIAESKDTPKSIAAKFAKAVKSGKIDEVDTPGFQLGLESARGEHVAALVQEAALQKENAFAARVAQLEAGTDDREIITEFLAELKETNSSDIDGLGFLGRRAAEPRLQEISERSVAGIRDKAKQLRADERDSLANVAVNSLVKEFSATSDSRDRQRILADIGAKGAALKLEGKVDWRQFLASSVIRSSAVIEKEQGAAAQLEFLEDAFLNVKTPTGEAVFADDPNGPILNAISQAEVQVKRERDDQPRKLQQQESEAKIAFQTSEGIEALDKARREGPRAVQLAAEVLREAIDSGDAETIQALGLTPETAKFARRFVDQFELNALRDASSFSAADASIARESILAEAFDVSPEAALERLATADLRPSVAAELRKEIKAIGESGSPQSFQALRGTGVFEKIAGIAATSLGPEPLQGALLQRTVQLENRLIERFRTGGFSAENPLTDEKARVLANEVLLELQEEFKPQIDSEFASGDDFLGSGEGDEASLDERQARAKRTADDLNFRNEVIQGRSLESLGGNLRVEAPQQVLDLEKVLIAAPERRELTSAGEKRSFASDFRAIFKDGGTFGTTAVEKSRQNATATETVARLGLMMSTDFVTGDLETVKHSLGTHLDTRGAPRSIFTSLGDIVATDSSKGEFVHEFPEWTEFDGSTLNPFVVPLADFRGINDFLIPDKTDPDTAVWNPERPLSESQEAGIVALLTNAGLAATPDAIKNVVLAQTKLWSN